MTNREWINGLSNEEFYNLFIDTDWCRNDYENADEQKYHCGGIHSCKNCFMSWLDEENNMETVQPYKMTLYICDLNNSNIEEIKQQIEDSLNTMTMNCMVRFEDVQTGKKIVWYDNVDINQLSATKEDWEKYFEED